MRLNLRATDDAMFALSAFDYALGRRTYIVNSVCNVLVDAACEMRSESIAYVLRGIDLARGGAKLGMQQDIDDWRRVEAVMKAELESRDG